MLKVSYGFAMATQFAGAVLAGLYVGGWAERRFGWEPWGTLGGAVLGMTAGIHGLIILVNKVRELPENESGR